MTFARLPANGQKNEEQSEFFFPVIDVEKKKRPPARDILMLTGELCKKIEKTR